MLQTDMLEITHIVKKIHQIILSICTLILFHACEKNPVEYPSSTINVLELKDHVFYLASDERRGRRAGSRDYYMAAGYAAAQFHASGLMPVCADSTGELLFFQHIPGSGSDSVFMAICSLLYAEGPDAYQRFDSFLAAPAESERPLAHLNVVALVRGTDPVYADEFITAGAHLDHLGVRSDSIYNGADDNASGCAIILEVAEAVALSHPKRSVLFILYDNEEGGMAGSGFFAKNPPVPVAQIKVNINLDMVGRPDGILTELGVLGADRIEPGLKELIYETNDMTSMLLLDSIDSRNYFRRSDQYSYFSEGIPSVLLTTGEHDEYHTPRDDPEKLDYEFLEKVSLLTYQVIMALADKEEP